MRRAIATGTWMNIPSMNVKSADSNENIFYSITIITEANTNTTHDDNNDATKISNKP